MKTSVIWFLAVGIILVTVSLFVLLQAADIPNRKNNGFDRDYLVQFDVPIVHGSIDDRIKRISGATDNEIYFSGTDPRWVMMYDFALKVRDTAFFGIAYSERLRDPGIYVDSPDVYMYGMEIAYLLKGRLDTIFLDTLKLKTELITRVAQISHDRVALRGLDSTQTKQLFKIMNARSGEVIHQKEIFSEQQFGGFERDGILKYDKKTNCLYYTQMFRNGIYCLDTSLNIKYVGRTIDTAMINDVEISLQNEGGITKLMPRKPRQLVNRKMEVFNGVVFILSDLKADNESFNEFRSIFAIDMYNGLNGKYIGSLSVPGNKNLKLHQFLVHKDRIIILYEGGECSIFKFNDKISRFLAQSH